MRCRGVQELAAADARMQEALDVVQADLQEARMQAQVGTAMALQPAA